MNLWERFKAWKTGGENVRCICATATFGEREARAHLHRAGMKFLVANFRSRRGEIDLVFQDGDCLVFVEVKTRSSETWTRPAAAVNSRKRRGCFPRPRSIT